jgi:hypothetical protein
MKFFYLLTFFLSVSLLSFAQSNYKPGYVVDLKNDTLKGFIDYQEWEINPKEFTFKSNLNQSQPQTFSTDNANGFGITGAEYFQKFTFSKTTASTNLNKISVKLDTNRIQDTSFLKIIIKGKNVSLYRFTDKLKTRFYILNSKDDQPVELDYYLYYVKEDNNAYQTLYTFRSQLQDLADVYNVKDPKLAGKIKYTNYKESDIKNVVELINGGSSLQNFEPVNVSGFRAFAGAAVRFNRLVTGGGNTFFPDGTSTGATSPVASVGIDYFINKHTQKVIFRVETEFSNTHLIIPPTVINGGGTTASLDFKQFNISLVPQLVYNVYSTDKLKVFIDGGIGFNFSVRSKYSYLLNFNNVSSVANLNFSGFNRYYDDFRVKTGFVISNKIEIYASHSFSAPVTSSAAYSASISFYQGGLNYLF